MQTTPTVQKLLISHHCVKSLHWVTCSLLTVNLNTGVYNEMIPHIEHQYVPNTQLGIVPNTFIIYSCNCNFCKKPQYSVVHFWVFVAHGFILPIYCENRHLGAVRVKKKKKKKVRKQQATHSWFGIFITQPHPFRRPNLHSLISKFMCSS